MKRAALVTALLASACSSEKPAPPAATGSSTPAATAAKAPAAEAPSPPPAAPEALLPASDRVFVVSLDGQAEHLLGANADQLWAVAPTRAGYGRPLWTLKGPGVVQRVAVGDAGRGHKLYVAWGVGRGFLQAPLVLQEVDPATGQATDLWRNMGERNETAHLSIADVDRDGEDELAFAYYTSKYQVGVRHLDRDGTTRPGPEVRMATSRLYADLNGDGQADEVIGRVYGDDKNLPGDLRVDFGQGAVSVPTDNGVKSLLVAKLADDPGPTLYFADGWVADYGKSARAQVKRVRWADGKPAVEQVAASSDEFTFFDLWAADIDGDGADELVGQGDKRVSAFRPGHKPWPARPLSGIDPVLNTALARSADGAYTLYVPARPATRAVPLK